MPVDAQYEALWERVRPYIMRQIAARYPPTLADDLLQEARLGVWLSMQRHDPRERASASTYATHLAMGRVQHYIADHGFMIRVPRNLRKPGTEFVTDRILPLDIEVDVAEAPSRDVDSMIVLQQALERLPAEELEAVISSFWLERQHRLRSRALHHLRVVSGLEPPRRRRGRPQIYDTRCSKCGVRIGRHNRTCGPCYQASRRSGR